MSPEEPFPPALPAVFDSPIGPAISYSNIRAVTSRAERTLDSLDKKIRKRLEAGMNDSGMVGAVVESKVRQRLADQIAPAEDLFSSTTDLIQNQIAGNLAPAVATLEDLQGTDESSQRASATTQTAGVGTPAVRPSVPPVEASLTPIPPRGPLGLARQLQRTTGSVAGGPRLLKPPQVKGDCSNPTKEQQDQLWAYGKAVADATPPTANDNATGLLGNWWWLSPTCCTEGPTRTPNDLQKINFPDGWLLAIDAPPDQAIAGFKAVLALWNAHGKPCPSIPPVDCKVHPLDPSCPPDCKTHPEDPRCPPTDTTCPAPCNPPCIEVNVPPCPPCPPLNLPPCIQIDLCDWKKFCDALTNCIGAAKEDCALDNDTAYTFKDCDGTFGDALKGLLGDLDGGSLSAQNMQELTTQSLAAIAALDATKFPLLAPF